MTAEQFHGETGGVFRDIYWNAADHLVDDDILRNRVALVRDFAINKRVKMYGPLPINDHCANLRTSYEHDHWECYATDGGGRLWVVSNYNSKPAPWLLMAEYPPIYNRRCTSWVRTFASAKDMRAVMAAFEPLAWCFDRRPLELMRKEIDAIELALRELQAA